jgi:hypothetical protein
MLTLGAAHFSDDSFRLRRDFFAAIRENVHQAADIK